MKNNKQISAKLQPKAERKALFQATANPKTPQAKLKQQTPQVSAVSEKAEEEENDPFNPTPEKPVSFVQKQALAKVKRNHLPKAKGRFHPDKTSPDTDADKTASSKTNR